MRKERVEGRKAYNGDQEATTECNSRRFLQPTSSLLSGLMYLTDRSSFSLLAEHMHLTKSGKARQNYALNKKVCA